MVVAIMLIGVSCVHSGNWWSVGRGSCSDDCGRGNHLDFWQL